MSALATPAGWLLLLLLGVVATVAATAAPLPPVAAVLADGRKASAHWQAETPLDNCGWTGGTFLIGLIEYYKATKSAGAADADALAYATRWGEAYDYQICGGPKPTQRSAAVVGGGACASMTDAVFDRGSNIGPTLKKSPAECCAACKANPKCKAWNTHPSGACHLHPAVGKVLFEEGSVAGVPSGSLPPKPPPGPSPSPHHSQQHNANNQLCGATFAELYLLDGATNATMLTSTKAILGAEIADPTHTSNLWSWVDALHMAMVRPSFR